MHPSHFVEKSKFLKGRNKIFYVICNSYFYLKCRGEINKYKLINDDNLSKQNA